MISVQVLDYNFTDEGMKGTIELYVTGKGGRRRTEIKYIGR